MKRERAQAVVVHSSPFINIHKKRIVELMTQHRLPAMFQGGDDVVAGGLVSYGSDSSDSYRRDADYVDKIFKGAKPADLPVEQPTKFNLTINHKTARALGVTVPKAVMLRADEVIQ